MNEEPSLWNPESDLISIRDAIRDSLQYKHDVFISYSRDQESDALTLFRALSLNHNVFYSPVSLQRSELTPDQFTEILKSALVQSCCFVALLSSPYLDSAWCQLEMHGFFSLCLNERRRKMWIKPLEPVSNQLIGQLVPFIFEKDLDKLPKVIDKHIKSSQIHVGELFAEYTQPRVFMELPLRERYEPPRADNRPPWGKDYRSPHGVPGAPSYETYEQLVREYMVQLMRGWDPKDLAPNIDRRYSYYTDCARNDAIELVELGVSPHQAINTRSSADLRREISQARAQGQNPADMDRLEGNAYANAGFFDKGISLMRSGLNDDDISANERYFFVVRIAMAEYGAKRYEMALEVLQELSEQSTDLLDAKLVRAAASVRLGRLGKEEINQNRHSEVSVNEIRIQSEIESREDLDHWAEGLKMAGFRA